MHPKHSGMALSCVTLVALLLAGCASPAPAPAPTTTPATQATTPPATSKPAAAATTAPTAAAPAPTPAASATQKPSSASPTRQAPDNTLVVAWSGDLNSMDPPNSLVEWNRELALNTYDLLLQYKWNEQPDGSLMWQGLDVAPALAESWMIEGPAVIFKLRKGVKFYPTGNEMTAEDVKYSFIRTMSVPGGFGKFNANLAGIFDGEKQIEIVDPYTVKITFTDAQENPMLLPASLPSMRFPQFSIVDSKLLKSKATADDAWAASFMKDNVAGTGPYYVDKRLPGQETVLKAVPGYWGPKPQFEQVILRVVKDPADIMALMRRGEVDLTTALGTRELASLEQAGYSVFNAPVPNIVRIDLALEKTPLNNKSVRQALAYAIPYDPILKNVFGGRGVRALSYVNPQSPGFAETFKPYSTNPQKVKELLQQGGVGSGFELDFFYDSGVPFFEDIALLVQDALRQYNISTRLNAVPTTKFGQDRTARQKGEPVMQGMWLTAGVIWLDDPDPNTESTIKTKGASNYTGYSNAEIDNLHTRFRFSSDTQGRQRAYEKIQQIVADDVPVIPVVVTGRNAVLNPKIVGMSFTADPHTRFWTLKLNRSG